MFRWWRKNQVFSGEQFTGIPNLSFRADPEDELLATVFRGLLSKTDNWDLQETTLAASGRKGWKLYVSSAVVMDREHMEAIQRAAEAG